MKLFNHRIALFSTTLLLLGVLGVRVFERYFSSVAEVLFFDVAQGESILLKLPKGRTYLIDVGSSTYPWLAGEELFRELGRKGILKLNGLIITHPDKDHSGGVGALLRHVSVDGFFYPQAVEMGELIPQALSRNIALHPISESWQIRGLGYQLTHTALIPPKKATPNNLSLVSLLEIYGCRFLFTGDIEKETERELLKKVRAPIHVLKVAHHGSVTSSQRNFLEKILPRHAVISVGAKNRYGHPRQEVLERLRFFKTKILRTDFNGFVSYRVTPQGELVCQNALGACGRFVCGS